jgi:hypothetical protein
LTGAGQRQWDPREIAPLGALVRRSCAERRECGFANAGFAAEQEESTRAGVGQSQRGLEARAFLRPTDERERCSLESRRQRRLPRDRRELPPPHLPGVHRRVEAFQHERSERLVDVVAAATHERPHHLGDADLVILCARTQARGLNNGDAEVVVAVYIGFTGRHADAHAQEWRALAPVAGV